ncbi:hypothetical protein HanRHA438_Chr09g0400341 [Helianthus annuus]|uniref:Uncharacterized protein n=1 Tax=Helianthus annuus TaxID=4232 RepID=A0A9K3N5B4_HELAN|nr:hypothetical protein HanXRQr2_Chr10g0454721 [Helianthus annuus]KAJ0600671.1 hypothetical protein HanIR_Chr03g0119721 [Helianthus annuus]KAJ0870604.1 hypothetical protein HanRHA438_Chr11g0502331 [Helianthus annuus]KAJ0884894.1 hypothetical protein HanPSC8_Chr10g0439111 [Helianthus annuus]KAJ0888284.1 hypothetical protein HanRHA438_Chr09g0400341 [Helianthus annuus]
MSLGKPNFRFKSNNHSRILSQRIVNGSHLSSILVFLSENIHFLFQYKSEGKLFGIVCFEILYNQSKG